VTKSLFSIRRFTFIFSACWLVLTVEHAAVLHWYGLNWNQATVDAAVSMGLLLLAALLMLNMFRFYVPRNNRYVLLFTWTIILTFIVLGLTRLGLAFLVPDDNDYTQLVVRSIPIRFGYAFLILGCIALMGMVWYQSEESREIEERQKEIQRLSKEAELFKLRQQLQPHFLFNSLNSINSLIGSRPAEARRMVLQLSDFLRGTIRKEDQQWIALSEEMQYLGLYLDIEKVRFGSRLSTSISIDKEAESMKIPAMLLQPLVENAIKFGLYDTTEEVVIGIYATAVNQDLLIKITNPFDPETASPSKGTGFGLKGVRRRLALLFNRSDLLQTQHAENLFITSVKVPQYG